MGLLDTVIGALAGRRGGAGGFGGLGGGGAQGALLTALIGMLAGAALRGQGGQGGPTDGQGGLGGLGGLGELIGRFNRGGLGDVVGSWVGTGENAPITGDQLSDVLGSDTIGSLAEQAGLSRGEAADQLSELLPQVVDRLTPEGRVPEDGLGDIGDILAQLSGR